MKGIEFTAKYFLREYGTEIGPSGTVYYVHFGSNYLYLDIFTKIKKIKKIPHTTKKYEWVFEITKNEELIGYLAKYSE